MFRLPLYLNQPFSYAPTSTAVFSSAKALEYVSVNPSRSATYSMYAFIVNESQGRDRGLSAMMRSIFDMLVIASLVGMVRLEEMDLC